MSLSQITSVVCPVQTQKGTVDPEGNRVGFWFPEGPKSSTRMSSKNTSRCWPAFQTHRGHKGMLFAFSGK